MFKRSIYQAFLSFKFKKKQSQHRKIFTLKVCVLEINIKFVQWICYKLVNFSWKTVKSCGRTSKISYFKVIVLIEWIIDVEKYALT
jgi:hypothetical protein